MIFAIDPGNKITTALKAEIDPQRYPSHVVLTDVVPLHVFRDICNAAVLVEIDRLPCGTVVLIEDIESFGMAVGREVFRTAQWAGRFEERAEANGLPVTYVKRSDVKTTLCYNRTAKDANIRAALIDVYGGSKELAIGLKATPGPLYEFASHAWSALALVVTWHKMKLDAERGITQQPVKHEAETAADLLDVAF